MQLVFVYSQKLSARCMSSLKTKQAIKLRFQAEASRELFCETIIFSPFRDLLSSVLPSPFRSTSSPVVYRYCRHTSQSSASNVESPKAAASRRLALTLLKPISLLFSRKH